MESTGDGYIQRVLRRDEGFGGYPPRFDNVAKVSGPVAPALYLRLLKLDLNDLDQVIQFCSEYGEMSGTTWSELLPAAWIDRGLRHANATSSRLQHLAELAHPRLAELRMMVEARSRSADEPFFHPEEFRLRARLLRDATRTWLAAVGTRTWAWALESWESVDLWTPSTLDRAVMDFVSPLLSVGLSTFHPRIEPAEQAPDPEHPLYGVICLQLASDIQSGQDIVDCPICHMVFSKQARAYEAYMERVNASYDLVDNSDLRQRSKDMIYCSTKCGNVATSRRYRRNHPTSRRPPNTAPSNPV